MAERWRPFEESRDFDLNDAIADAVDELWRRLAVERLSRWIELAEDRPFAGEVLDTATQQVVAQASERPLRKWLPGSGW